MIHFNISNPSDPYTMQAPDLEIAATAICLLGHGQYGLEQIGGDRAAQVPIFMMGGHDEWFTKQFGRDFGATLSHVATTRRDELVQSLASVHIGTPADKREFDELATQFPEDEAMVKLLHERHDAKRTSSNDIGRAAWALAQQISVADFSAMEATAPE